MGLVFAQQSSLRIRCHFSFVPIFRQSLTFLNQVRQRAGLPAYTGLTKDEFREKVYLERRLELYLEGHRWFDLVRTGRALAVMAPFGMKPYMTIFPIPLTELEIIRNPAVFAQNPGYE